jgi:hypothetical protein
MRYISPSMLTKINKKIHTQANDNDPRINLILQRTHRYIEQGAIMAPITLWERDNLGPIAVTYRREDHMKAPDYVYIVYIEAGIAHVVRQEYIKSIEERNDWEYLYALGPAIDVAIEFDGRWERTHPDAEVCFDSPARWSLVTFGEPYIFRVLPGGSLVVHQGNGAPFELVATGVTKIAALRGWKNVYRWNHDHGLICAYVRDGAVYYRSYCMQGDDSDPRPAAWEIERDPGLPTPAQDVALFRTNDYRVGILAESNGEIHWKISDRNWAGMAIPPHTVAARGDGVYVRFARITYHEGQTVHTVTGTGLVDLVSLLYAMPDNAWLHVENDGPTTVCAHARHYLTNLDPVDFRIVDSAGLVFGVLDVTNGGKDFIFTVENLNFSTPGDLTLKFLGSGNTKGEAGQDVDPFELTFTPTGLDYVDVDPPEVEAIWNE